jgi:Family of unknown function (DUF5343)
MDDNNSQSKDGASPPYIAFQSLKTLCGLLKEHGVPSRIDRTVLGNFSGGVGGQVLTALKFMRLTDGDGHPTDKLRALVSAYGTDLWPDTLASIIGDAYKPIFELNLESVSPGQFNEKFRTTYPGKDDTLRKCQGFFINALRESAIPVGAYLMKNKKPRSGPTKRRAKVNGQKTDAEQKQQPGVTPLTPPPGDQDRKHPKSVVNQLLDKFPPFDPAWTDDLKAKWFDGYQRLLAMGEK